MRSNWTVYNILLVTKQSSRLGFTDSGSRNEDLVASAEGLEAQTSNNAIIM